MNIKTIAIYLDIENISVNLSVQDLMDDIRLKYQGEDDVKIIYAYKIAVGQQSAFNKYINQLKELNFDIKLAPNVTGKKNRSDLIISVDAFEKLYLEKPKIDLFVFLTSDADYSIIMDKLRRHSKEVWLVATDKDAQRGIFKSSADKILSMNEYKIQDPESVKKTDSTKFNDLFGALNKNEIRAIKAMLKVLKSYDVENEYMKGTTNNLFRTIENTLNLESTKFKKFDGIYKVLNEKKVIQFNAKSKGQDTLKVINKKLINDLLK